MNNPGIIDIKNKRCAIYCRKSTEHGMEQEYTSIDAQRDSCRQYIMNHAAEGWVEAGVYEDIGVSGATLDRPQLKRLLEDVDKGLVDCIVAYKLDRISRSVRDFSNLTYDLEQKGVALVITTQHLDTSTPVGKVLVTLLSSFAEFERDMTITRIRDKTLALARQGNWNAGVPSYGYRLGEKRTLVIDEPAAAVVRRIFAMTAGGMSPSAIKKVLVRENLPAPRGKPASAWVTTRIREILQRRIYVGKIVCQGVEYQGKHEPIITEADWCAAHDAIRAPRRRRKVPPTVYPLQGILICPDCGAPLTGIRNLGRSIKGYDFMRRYYVCSNHRRRQGNCRFSGFSAPMVEKTVARHLATLANDKDVLRALKQKLPQLDRLDIKAALADVELLVGNLSDEALDTIFHALYEKITFDPVKSELHFTRYTA